MSDLKRPSSLPLDDVPLVSAGAPTEPLIPLLHPPPHGKERKYLIKVVDDSLADVGIVPGDLVTVASWMLQLWGDTEYIGLPVILASETGLAYMGWYQPPYLVNACGAIVLKDDMQIVGCIEALYRPLSKY